MSLLVHNTSLLLSAKSYLSNLCCLYKHNVPSGSLTAFITVSLVYTLLIPLCEYLQIAVVKSLLHTVIFFLISYINYEHYSLFAHSCVYYRAGAWKFKTIWFACILTLFTILCTVMSLALTCISFGFIPYNAAITIVTLPSVFCVAKINYRIYFHIATDKIVGWMLGLCQDTCAQMLEYPPNSSCNHRASPSYRSAVVFNNDNVVDNLLIDTQTLDEFIANAQLKIKEINNEKRYHINIFKCDALFVSNVNSIEMMVKMAVDRFEKDKLTELIYEFLNLIIVRYYHFPKEQVTIEFFQTLLSVLDKTEVNMNRISKMLLGIRCRAVQHILIDMITDVDILTHLTNSCSGRVPICKIKLVYKHCTTKSLLGILKRIQKMLIAKYEFAAVTEYSSLIQHCANKLGEYELELATIIGRDNIANKLSVIDMQRIIQIYYDFPNLRERIGDFYRVFITKRGGNLKNLYQNSFIITSEVPSEDFYTSKDPLSMPIEMLNVIVNTMDLPTAWLIPITQTYPDIMENHFSEISTNKINKKMVKIFPENKILKMYKILADIESGSVSLSDSEWISFLRTIKLINNYRTQIKHVNKTWVIAKLEELGCYLGNIMVIETSINFDWGSAGNDSWNVLRATKGWRSSASVRVKSGVGYDAGGLTRAMYWDVGQKASEGFEKYEGYLLPKPDMVTDLAFDLGALIARCALDIATPVGMDIHPALYYFCGAHNYLQGCSWEVIEFSLGKEVLNLMAPETLYNRTPDTLTSEILTKYSQWMPSILSITKAFIILSNIKLCYSYEYLRKKVCGIKVLIDGNDGLLFKLRVTGDGSDEYKVALSEILHSWNQEEVETLFKFWFGCPRPDFHGTVPCMHITNTVGLAQSATCSYQLRVPYYQELSGGELRIKLDKCLRRTLEEQAAAESGFMHFSLA